MVAQRFAGVNEKRNIMVPPVSRALHLGGAADLHRRRRIPYGNSSVFQYETSTGLRKGPHSR
jgi:hypothetical protein